MINFDIYPKENSVGSDVTITVRIVQTSVTLCILLFLMGACTAAHADQQWSAPNENFRGMPSINPTYSASISSSVIYAQNGQRNEAPGQLRKNATGFFRPIPVATTVQPARENLTTILTRIVERQRAFAEDIKVTAILILVVIAIVIAYLVFRWRRKKNERPVKPVEPADLVGTSPGIRTTVLDIPAGQSGSNQQSDNRVQFPPSLEKKFADAEFIGEGGLAKVFRAKNMKTGETVAIKVPARFDEETGIHFTRDILHWQELHHKNIIQVRSSNILPVPYIEMEYATTSLAGQKLPLDEKRALAIIHGVAEGLAYAHERGIIHRDIKPENILLDASGIPKITDWGLAKAIEDPRQTAALSFSPAYAAPEQVAPDIFGKPGVGTDIYQLGVLFCELLTGSVPFSRKSLHETTNAIVSDKPEIRLWEGSHVDEIQLIIQKCLEKQPQDRYRSVTAFLSDLDKISGG